MNTTAPPPPPPTLHAAILTIGDEIITGHLVDTNAAYLAAELSKLEITVTRQVSVGDDHAAIVEIIRQLAADNEIIIVTGGLGPTLDDLTRAALADALGTQLVIDPHALENLKARYEKRAAPLSESNTRQAERPVGAECIPNAFGTAPGLLAQLPRTAAEATAETTTETSAPAALIFCVPGVPREMREMYQRSVQPKICAHFSTRLPPPGCLHLKLLHCIGLAESRLGEQLADLMQRGANPLIATLPHDCIVTIRLRTRGTNPADTAVLAEQTAQQIRARVGQYIFAEDDNTLTETIHGQLRRRRQTVAVAESCTAGLLGLLLTEPPGASAVFLGGWQTYTNALKTKCLGVKAALINQHGAVSDEVAAAMAEGALHASGADYALAITGIAGPAGGTENKPVGTVYIALAARTDTNDTDIHPITKHFRIPGARDEVRTRAALSALGLLYFQLARTPRSQLPKMLFEY